MVLATVLIVLILAKYPTGPNNDSFSGYLDDGQIMLADGTFWLFEQSGFITIDINGYNNPPNKVGNDVFYVSAN